MKRAVLAVLAAMVFGVACANSEQSVTLERFIPFSEEDQCKINVDSKYWTDEGIIDIYFAAYYPLMFKVVNNMETSSSGMLHEADKWVLKNLILWYELPPIPGVDESVWERREIVSGLVIDPDGGKAAGEIDIITTEQNTNLQEIFALFAANSASFDWWTYPIIVTVQAEGEKMGGGDVIRTNKLRFNLVPVYGSSVIDGSLYPVDPDWPTDDELEDMYPDENEREQAQYERDKEIYERQIEFCSFSSDHLVDGCYPGIDGAMIDCYGAPNAEYMLESLFPGWECCPEEKPTEPEEPSGT